MIPTETRNKLLLFVPALGALANVETETLKGMERLNRAWLVASAYSKLNELVENVPEFIDGLWPNDKAYEKSIDESMNTTLVKIARLTPTELRKFCEGADQLVELAPILDSIPPFSNYVTSLVRYGTATNEGAEQARYDLVANLKNLRASEHPVSNKKLTEVNLRSVVSQVLTPWFKDSRVLMRSTPQEFSESATTYAFDSRHSVDRMLPTDINSKTPNQVLASSLRSVATLSEIRTLNPKLVDAQRSKEFSQQWWDAKKKEHAAQKSPPVDPHDYMINTLYQDVQTAIDKITGQDVFSPHDVIDQLGVITNLLDYGYPAASSIRSDMLAKLSEHVVEKFLPPDGPVNVKYEFVLLTILAHLKGKEGYLGHYNRWNDPKQK